MPATRYEPLTRGNVVRTTTSYFVRPEDETIFVANSGTAVTVTLPTLPPASADNPFQPIWEGVQQGRRVTITRNPTSATGPASTGAVTISGGGLQSIQPLTIFTGFTATTSLGTGIGQRTITFQACQNVWRIVGLG